MSSSTLSKLGSDRKVLLALVLLHTAASLAHFVHNATFLADYPNMPAWLSPVKIYSVWLAQAVIGAVGVLLVLRGRAAGFLVIAAYAALGFAGFDHYVLAPMRAHTLAMNSSIVAEAVTASAVLVCVGVLFAKQRLIAGRRS